MSLEIPRSVITGVEVEIKDSSELGISLPIFLPPPVLVSPVNNHSYSARVSVTFSWQAVTFATLYEMQLSEQGDFLPWDTETFRTASTSISVGGAGSDFSFPIKADEQQNWRVRALTGIQSSKWSEVRTFRIRPPVRVELPFPPYIKDVTTDHDEIKPSNGEVEEKNMAHISVEMAETSGGVDGFRWRLAGAGQIIEESATGCTFIAPTVAEIALEDSLTAQEVANMLCNVGTGRTATITFYAENKGGSSNGKCDINIRYQAGDKMEVEPDIEGADFYEEEE